MDIGYRSRSALQNINTLLNLLNTDSKIPKIKNNSIVANVKMLTNSSKR